MLSQLSRKNVFCIDLSWTYKEKEEKKNSGCYNKEKMVDLLFLYFYLLDIYNGSIK